MPFSVSARFLVALLLGLALATVVPCEAAATSQESVSASSAADAQFTLQIASFEDRHSAEGLSQKIAGAWIQVVIKDKRQVFRVNVGRFNSRAEAIRIQWSLEDAGFAPALQQVFA